MFGGVSGDFRQTRAAPINLHTFRKNEEMHQSNVAATSPLPKVYKLALTPPTLV